MIGAVQRQKSTEVGILDYVLGATGSALATYSAGMGLSNPDLGFFFTALVILGTFFSYMMSRIARSPLWQIGSGFLYAFALVAGVFFARSLNPSLPDGGFPWQLMIAGVLSWMLLFGSFFVWRDSSLLFQAVPAIALFGMVGTWDTFQGSVLAFFVFLLCLATLFARTHARMMLQQAKLSGYLGIQQRHDPPTDADLDTMQRGPWRWMAGPEWALASAAGVVVISLIGAPILQESVKGVSQAVRIQVPIPPSVRAAAAATGAASGEARIGNGPLTLSDTPVLLARMDQAYYMRGHTYDRYSGRGWQNTYYIPGGITVEPERMVELARTLMKDPVQRRFDVEIVGGVHTSLPIPGYVVSVDSFQLRYRADGTIEIPGSATSMPRTRVTTMLANESIQPANTLATPQRQRFLDVETIRPLVRQFASENAKGETDYERARALKRAIGRAALYNINAEAVPSDVDPVEHFLFGSREGYCDLFASAMVQGARAIGIPARYVTGYLPDTDAIQSDGRYVVRSKDAHAWAELYFEDAGWVVFDPTEDAAAVEGGERGAANQSVFPMWLIVGLSVICGTAVLLGLWVLFRRTMDRRKVVLQREQAARLLAMFLRTVEAKVRRPRLQSQTSMEFLNSVRDQLGEAGEGAVVLNDRLEVAMFARAEPEPSDIEELRALVLDFRRRLKALRVAS